MNCVDEQPARVVKVETAEATPLCGRLELGRALLAALVPMLVTLALVTTCDWFTLVDDDGLCQYQPLLSEALARVFAGDWPWWSHHSGCGYPLFARSGVLYPPHYVAHVICRLCGLPNREIAVAHWLHLGAAAAAAYLYLRAVRAAVWPAFVAAVAYAMTGPMLGMATNWNEYCFLMAYVPLAFLGIEKVVAGDDAWLWTVLLGLIGSLVFLGTGALGAFKYALLFGLYFAARFRPATAWLCVTRFAIAALLALVGCLGAFLAGKEVLDWSTRTAGPGLTPEMGLGVMACAPEFFRGFVYPLVEFDWVTGNDWSPLFEGGTLFAGPLAALAAALAVVHFRRSSGPQRALLVLLAAYGLLALGWYWRGNYLLHPLPFFKQHRWPVRWAVELCGLAALLSGPALSEGWRRRHELGSRLAASAFFLAVVVAVTVRTPLSTEWEFGWRGAAVAWVVGAAALVYCFRRGSERAFFSLALVATVAALTVNTAGAQRQRWAALRGLLNDPIRLPEENQERVLYLANRAEQRGHAGEGNFSYCFPHQFGNRTVLTYGPFQLKTQVWQAGINSQGEIEDEDAVLRAVLGGHALDTLRVGRVVVANDNARLNAACRAHPHLKFETARRWKNVYRNEGFRAPAFFVRELIPESKLDTMETLSRADLPRVGFIQDDFPGPRQFSGEGTVRDFHEQHGTIQFQTETPSEQLVAVTTTWYPGWQATLDGRPWPLYRVNGSFLAVQVPAGTHEVKLTFWPERIVAFSGLSVVMLVGMFGFCAASAWRRLGHGPRRHGPITSPV